MLNILKRMVLPITLLAVAWFGTAHAQSPPKNILVIMSDDQRWDTVAQMPSLSAIAKQGVVFPNAFQPTPLCGPSRSMLFSGGYRMQDTGVLGNDLPNGSVIKFNDKTNLGVMLQGAGYDTTFIGKWINGYENLGQYVPPGWNHWEGRHSFATGKSWFQFQYVIGSSTTVSNKSGIIVNSNAYTTYWERDQVLNSLNAALTMTKPFFILWMPSAPHAPATPAPEDVGLYTDYLYRDRGVTETDLSDKPHWVQHFSPASLGAYGVAYGDPYIQNQLRALQGVDRSIQAIIDRLKANGQYDNTLIIYSGDNGYQWGEHTLWGKAMPYQESLRVPFVAFMPGIAPRVDQSIIAPSLDIGPTLFELAGITKVTAGQSILPLLNDPAAPWRTSLYIEETDSLLNNSLFTGNAIYAGIVTANNEYAKYGTGEEELYDLVADPFQLNNLHNDPTQAALKASLLATATAQLGLAIVPVPSFKAGKVGSAYRYQMRIWGGFAPFHWIVASGALPPGLTIYPARGTIAGVPRTAGTYRFALNLTDSSLSPQTSLPHTFTTRVMKLVIN